jgi:hypothetical protein
LNYTFSNGNTFAGDEFGKVGIFLISGFLRGDTWYFDKSYDTVISLYFE